MKEKQEKQPFSKSEYLAGYQILGGLVGLCFCVTLMFQVPEFNLALLIIFLIITILYGHSILSGVLIFRNINVGLKHSLINQIFQLIFFSFYGITFQFYAGISINLTWILTESGFPYINFGFSSWRLAIQDDDGARILGVNIIAVVLLIFIQRQRRSNKVEDVKEEIYKIGS